MLGILKKLWRRRAKPAPVEASAPARPRMAVRVIPRPGAQPLRGQTSNAPSSNGVAHRRIAADGQVGVTLGSIEPCLPEPLRHKIAGALQELISVPVEKIVPQLPHGSVAMSVRDLRGFAPDLLSILAEHDDLSVTLPLCEIVPQLDPSCFTRRQPLRRIEVPAEVSPIFTQTATGAVIAGTAPAAPTAAHANSPLVAPVATATATTVPQRPTIRIKPSSIPEPKAQAAAPAPAPLPQAPIAAPQPSVQPKISLSNDALAALAASAPAKPSPAAPQRIITPAQHTAPAQPAQALPRQTAPSAPVRPVPAVPAPAPMAAPQPASRPAETSTPPLPIPFSKIADSLPQEVRSEIYDVDVTATTLMVPMSLVEAGLRSGKVLFTWHDLASWLTPPLPRPESRATGEIIVELPLKTIAPLFMAHHRANGGQKKAEVDQNIPDLFQLGNGRYESGSLVQSSPVKAPAPQAPAAPLAPAPVKMPASAVATPAAPRVAAPVTPTPPPAANNGAPSLGVEDIIGSEQKRLSPKQIVQNTIRIPGVTGALVAMPDGLPVASAVAPSVNSDTVAAFLPQMFGRMSQYTKELGLGPLQSMALHVEGGCWQIFKQPNIYFAVSGKPGEVMPYKLLTQIAAELSKQTV